MTTTISIHQAFAKMKILKKRIPQKINTAIFINQKVASSKVLNGLPISIVEANMKQDYQSLKDDMALLTELTTKIQESNAKTLIKVGNTEYTILEALAIKNNIMDFKEDLLNGMNSQFVSISNAVQRSNDTLDDKADTFISETYKGLSANELKTNPDLKKEREEYITSRQKTLVDPLKLKNEIEVLSKEIDNFVSNIDAALSVSNAITTIDIESKVND